MKWVTHFVWGAIAAFVVLGCQAYSPDLLGRVALATIIGDIISHFRGRRFSYHDFAIMATHMAVFYTMPLVGILVGVTHIALDKASKGWFDVASFVFLMLGLLVVGFTLRYVCWV